MCGQGRDSLVTGTGGFTYRSPSVLGPTSGSSSVMEQLRNCRRGIEKGGTLETTPTREERPSEHPVTSGVAFPLLLLLLSLFLNPAHTALPPSLGSKQGSVFLPVFSSHCLPPDTTRQPLPQALAARLAVCPAAYQCAVSSLSTSTIGSSFPPGLAGQEASRAPGFLQGQQQATYVSCGWGSPQGSPGPEACVVPWVFHIRDPTATACPPPPPRGSRPLAGFLHAWK